MKTLSATADRLRQRRDAELRWVLALTLYRDRFGASPTSTTYYLSDRSRAKVVGGAGVLGQDWLPLVRDWGALTRGLEPLRPGATPATLDLVLTNTAPIGGIGRFTNLLRQGLNTSGADLAFGDAVLSVVFVDGSTEAAIPIAQLLVDDLTSVTEETVTLRCNGRETLLELQVVAAEFVGMTCLGEDDFDRPDNTSLGSCWTRLVTVAYGGRAMPQILSGTARAAGVSGDGSGAWLSGAQFLSLDQYSQILLENFSGGSIRQASALLRVQTAIPSWYEVVWYAASTDRYEVSRFKAGTFSVLEDEAIGPGGTHIGNSDLLKATVTGSAPTTIRVYRNDVLITTVIDAADIATTGAPGFGMFVNTSVNDVQVTTWQGGNL